jgi:hypothetical protein
VHVLAPNDELEKLMITHWNHFADVRVPDGRVQEVRVLAQLCWVQRSQMCFVKVRQLRTLEVHVLRHAYCGPEAASVGTGSAI